MTARARWSIGARTRVATLTLTCATRPPVAQAAEAAWRAAGAEDYGYPRPHVKRDEEGYVATFRVERAVRAKVVAALAKAGVREEGA